MSKGKFFIEPWIDENGWNKDEFKKLETPCYVVDEKRLEDNLRILAEVRQRAGIKIMMALKGFAMHSLFPIIEKYLDGVAAGSLYEAKLGAEKFKGEIEVFAPAYFDQEIKELSEIADHLIFNSFGQWKKYGPDLRKNKRKISFGIRVNPEHREVETDLYDPAGKYSRLGVRADNFKDQSLDGISGLHFHTLCEHNADAFERTLKVFEEKFGKFLAKMEWVNFGGGHHLTRKDYDLDLFYKTINGFIKRYPHLRIYIEPGEAITLNIGVLVGTVLGIVNNEKDVAILDVSAHNHMPDVLAMPYWPQALGGGLEGKYEYNYRFGGLTCLAGDIIGDYSFPKPLKVGDKIVFMNQAHYTMVQTSTMCGVGLPSIAVRKKSGEIKIIKKFGYEDFKNRLS
ncbi:MAG: carboxynorspermidine decarboxylase [Candidatus Portnoybacteria bacterium]|nr:carboxynorspermidine decarboxylase [Candidatus Portnoybacteria bacterium]